MKSQAVIITAFCMALEFGSYLLVSGNFAENPRAICAFNGLQVSFINDKCQLIDSNCRTAQSFIRWRELPMWVCFKQLNSDIQQTCNRNFSEDYNPVCAADGKHIQIFSTRDHFDMENCLTNNRWMETDLKVCSSEIRTKNRFIILEIDGHEDSSDVLNPICAIETGTLRRFDDKCAMHYDTCTINREWKQTNMTLCEEEEARSRCYWPCPGLYRPICGFDGKKKKLFDNICIFNVENCISGWKWTELYRYDCIQ